VSFSYRNPRARLLAATIACAFALPAAARPVEDNVDRFIVRFKADSAERGNATARQRLLDGIGHKQGLQIGQQRHLALGAELIRTSHALNANDAKALLLRLQRDPSVEYAVVDARKHASFTPNDTYYATKQWHYFDATSGINAPAAWDIATGTGVVVAVLDTGIRPHIDLDSNIIAGYDFISDAPTGNDGDARDADPSDPGDWVVAGECGTGSTASNSSWHGTHVSGTVAAETNNNQGMAGVAFDAKVQPVRVLGKCGGYTSDIAEAMIWASGGTITGVPANATPAEVINMSLGGGGSCDPFTQEAINTAVANGTTVVVAAGNDNDDAANYSPASCENVITVGAVGKTGKRASYSNYGPKVDVSAPGGDLAQYVWSTLNAGTTTPGADNYAGYQGTSMATPHVAGTVALMQSYKPQTPAVIETVLRGTTRPLATTCTLGCGTGIIDAAAALTALDTPFLYVDDVGSVLEGDSGTKTVTFTVRLSEAVGTAVTFDIATANGTATAGSDYVAKTSTAQSIPAGTLSKTFTVTVNGDATTEADETFFANVTNVVGVTVMDAQGSATIANDEAIALTNGVALTGQSAAAGASTLYKLAVPAGATDLSFNLSGGGGGDADLYVKANMSPTQSVDCASEGPTATEMCAFASPDAGTYYVLVKAYSAYSNLTVLGSYTAPPTGPALTIADVGLAEGNSGTTAVTFTVKLAAASATDVTYDIATANGTSTTANNDYVAKALVGETIPAGQTSKTFTVLVNGDTTVEPNENFYVNVSNVVGASVVDGQGRANNINDDGPTLRIADVSIGEGDAGTKTLTATVLLTKVAAVPVTYNINTSDGTALAGSDYVAKSLVGETIPAGQTTKTFTVTINGDTTFEQNETFRINIANPVSGASVYDSQAVATILNDEGPTLSINDIGFAEGNTGTKTVTFTVSLSQVSASDVTYTIATAAGTEGAIATPGSDYVHKSMSDTIVAGQLSKTFTVTVNGDTATEKNEYFYVNLSNPTNATLFKAQGKANITNDDGPTLRIGDATVSEGNAGTKVMTFTVTMSQAKGTPVTYNVFTGNGTATAGSDYVANSLVGETIPAGMTSKTFSVTINGDATVEPDETLTATLSAAVGASIFDPQGIGTITNDD
jgi:serine protease